MSRQQIVGENILINNLIEIGRDDFDIAIFIEFQDLTGRIKRKRCISSQAARKIACELLQHEVKAK